VNPLTTSAFDLPDHLAPKAAPTLIARDEQPLRGHRESLEQSIADLSDHLDAERRAPGGTGQLAMDRDMEIHRLTARLRALRRFGLDLCLGHIVSADNPDRQPRRQPVGADAERARHHPGRPGRHQPRGIRRRSVVDGGPGTGKTVVALHRAAYLFYADPRLGHRRGGVHNRRSLTGTVVSAQSQRRSQSGLGSWAAT
jgi:hypothetical protein